MIWQRHCYPKDERLLFIISVRVIRGWNKPTLSLVWVYTFCRCIVTPVFELRITQMGEVKPHLLASCSTNRLSCIQFYYQVFLFFKIKSNPVSDWLTQNLNLEPDLEWTEEMVGDYSLNTESCINSFAHNPDF